MISAINLKHTMGRWSYSSKEEADHLTKLDVSFLNKHGFFEHGYHSETITWTRSGMWGEKKSSISVSSSVYDSEKKVHLNYVITKQDEEKKTIDYDIPLATTPCNYGGVRYWFVCPLSRDGKYCGRRVGTMYLGNGDYFACRHCYDLTYGSKKQNRRYKYAPLFEVLGTEKKIEDLQDQIKRPYYAGKPTRKQRKLEHLHSKTSQSYRRYLQLERKKLL